MRKLKNKWYILLIAIGLMSNINASYPTLEMESPINSDENAFLTLGLGVSTYGLLGVFYSPPEYRGRIFCGAFLTATGLGLIGYGILLKIVHAIE